MVSRGSSGRVTPLALLLLVAVLPLAAFALWLLPERAEGTRTPGTTPAPTASTPGAPAPVALQAARVPAPPAASTVPARTGRLVLQLVAPTGGLPEEPVLVTLKRADGHVEPQLELTRAAPLRELECEPGELVVTARTSGARKLASQPTHTTVRAGTSAFVELELAPSVGLRGFVRDEEGAVLEGIAVALARRGALEARAETDAAGRFALAPLPAGEYELVLGDPLGPLVPRSTLVLGEGDGPREIVVPALLTLDLRVVDGHGAPAVGALVEGTGKPGGRLSGTTDADGRLHVEQLPPGDYRLYARHAELGRATVAMELDSARAAHGIELVLYR
ncbi:MAG: carboxypeptidase-like regulatory domain-containing protein [Planctomycetota bacterium]